jgi:hypothetical protein
MIMAALRTTIGAGVLVGAGVLLALAAPASAAAPSLATNSGWLLRQADLAVASVTGELPANSGLWLTDFGTQRSEPKVSDGQRGPLVPMLMSMVVPGAGELYLGYKRGLLLIAADAAAWYGVAHNADIGREKRDEYYAFADVHWSEGKLEAAYDPDYDPNHPEYSGIIGIGTRYFGVNGYEDLPLWVSARDDRREYYENLGKWDQFVFGWDDFQDPRAFLQLDPEDFDIANLRDPRTSANREIYRQMRQDSNDAFARRDRFLYLNLGLRVISVLQVAYLEGLLFGNGGASSRRPHQLEIAGREVDLIVEPIGFSRGVIGAKVSF